MQELSPAQSVVSVAQRLCVHAANMNFERDPQRALEMLV